MKRIVEKVAEGSGAYSPFPLAPLVEFWRLFRPLIVGFSHQNGGGLWPPHRRDIYITSKMQILYQ